MSFVNKELYENAEKQKKSAQITREISDCIRQVGASTQNAFPLIPYLLYKASLYNNPFGITLQAIVNGKIDIDNDASLMAKETLTDDLWEHLLQLVTKYSPEEFALAVISPVIENDPRATMPTPDSILKLAHELLNVKAGEKVADVCCGIGSYIVSAAMKEPRAFYRGYEINVANKAAAKMKAELLDADIEVTLCDVFTLADAVKMPKYDKIFANYPFGLKLRNSGAGIKYLEKMSERYPGLSKATSSDWIFNALLCDMLEKDGRAIGIMTNGSTWNSIDLPMRKYFIEQGLVECVIALPGRMFSGTNIPTTLIVLSHNNKSVRMIDATQQCQQGRRQNEFNDENIQTIIDALEVDREYSKNISIEELRKNEYILSLSRYVEDEVCFQDGVPFESIIKNISRGAPCTAKQLDEMVSDNVTNMQYLMLANIQDGIIDDKLPYLSYIDPKYDRYCLKDNSLILSKNGFPYKVAVASVKQGQRILANGNLYVIELDEDKANPYYVKSFLESEQGHAVLKSITVGATMPNIGVDKLKKVRIPLPSMEEQERVAQAYEATLDEIAVIKLHLEKAIDKLHHILDEECG